MRHLLLVLIALITINVQGQEFPEPQSPRRLVNDFTGLLRNEQKAYLEKKLRNFNDTTSTQIVVAVVSSLNDLEANDYAQRLAEKWGIGQKGKDNGILLVVKPKTRRENGQVAIAVGYGLEGVIPDAIAARIIRNEIIPAFQHGEYFRGINKATQTLMQLSAGEFTAEQYAHKGKKRGLSLFQLLPLFLFLFFALLLRKRRGYTTGSQGGTTVPPIFFGGFGSHRSRDFGSFSSGSGSFGGFDGFGGGSFGGGGASGSW